MYPPWSYLLVDMSGCSYKCILHVPISGVICMAASKRLLHGPTFGLICLAAPINISSLVLPLGWYVWLFLETSPPWSYLWVNMYGYSYKCILLSPPAGIICLAASINVCSMVLPLCWPPGGSVRYVWPAERPLVEDDGVKVFNRSGTSVKWGENSPLREVKAIKISALGLYASFSSSFFGIFDKFWRYVLFSTVLHLSPLIFYCIGGCCTVKKGYQFSCPQKGCH